MFSEVCFDFQYEVGVACFHYFGIPKYRTDLNSSNYIRCEFLVWLITWWHFNNRILFIPKKLNRMPTLTGNKDRRLGVEGGGENQVLFCSILPTTTVLFICCPLVVQALSNQLHGPFGPIICREQQTNGQQDTCPFFVATTSVREFSATNYVKKKVRNNISFSARIWCHVGLTYSWRNKRDGTGNITIQPELAQGDEA